MKHKLLFITFLACFSGWGQTANGTLDFGSPTNGITASTANTGFGGVRVGSTGGGFTIQNPGKSIGSQGELRGIAPTSASINSVGITSNEYGTAASTFSIAFDLHLSGGSSGTWYFFAGNGASFAAAQSNAFTGSQVFTGLRWVFGASDAITTNNRNVGTWDTTGITGVPFTQNIDYRVIIVGNNSSTSVNYGSNVISSYKYDLWVNGVLVGEDLAKGQISNGTDINAFRFYGESSTSNVAQLAIDNVVWYNSAVDLIPTTSTTYTTSWSNSTPTATIDAIINGDLTTTTDLTCKDLTINSGKTLTIGAGKKLSVTGNLINNGTLVFKSDATGTAVFDVFSGSLSPAGSTIVERFIPARRAYRFLSPSVTTSTTIRQNWQEDGVNTAGFGTHITGATGASAGFDPTETNNPSLLRLTNGAWAGATNTNVNTLTAGNAYCLMVRGDRTTDLTTNLPATSNTVLRATGTLFTGNFTPVLSAVASGYSFIGNPYQAPLDIKTALQSSSDVNKNVVYYWDPSINARGGYITRNLQTSQNSPSSFVNDYVQPGQAFFVINRISIVGTPTLTFTENHKSVANPAAGAFRTANTNEYGTLRVNLQANTNNQWTTIDGALAIFNDAFSWNVTSEDATKMANLDEDVSFVQNNTNLAIALQSIPSATSELPIKIDKMRHTYYQWKFELDNYNGATPFLFDTLNNSYTQINNGTAVPFTADANTTNRFKIVFQNVVLSNATFQNTLAIYPNPAKAGASFYIEGVSEATVTVSNLLGQTVPVQTKSQGTTLQVTPNTSLSQGVYLVNITTQGTTQQVKWIVE